MKKSGTISAEEDVPMLDLQPSIARKTFTKKDILPMKQELQFPVVN